MARRPITIALIVLGTCFPAGCGSRPEESRGEMPFRVMVSIPPLADFAAQVGGARVRVETLVPPGASPHTYELIPSQLHDVSRARLLVLNGLGLEYWAQSLISAAGNPDLIVVTTSDGLEVLSGDPDEPGGNPHVWLSPRNAVHQVEAIRDALVRADPEGADLYRANA
ncbi:MAG: zinc ABC transporter substrate-binding protein, partial [Acidobacteria bacterium]|nr:zinc ABC transporter substrate-binding protein [Acidobacteriota bacterium]